MAQASAPSRVRGAVRARPGSADGRVARGERTRRALAEAVVALIEEGDPQPTARRVSERAGVSLRLVFHHFDDMESVLQAAVAVQVERHWSRLRPIDPQTPLLRRVERIVRQRAALFERIAPVRRAATLVEHGSPVVAAELAHSRHELRAELESAFEPELAAAGRRRAELLDMLELPSSFEAWDALRRRMGLAPAAARRVTTRLLEAALCPTTDPEA